LTGFTPRWWYDESPNAGGLVRLALIPVSWVWAEVTAQRLRRVRPVDPGPPVICVGNLTLGGTGKTPVVRAILQRLRARGVALR
jgi:tetraacyldisaccharide 4'-kinase